MDIETERAIAEILRNEDIVYMFGNAKNSIKNWKKRANKSTVTLGGAWNILYGGFDPEKKASDIQRLRMVQVFGKYLHPDILKLFPKEKRNPPLHQEQIFGKQCSKQEEK